MKKMYLLILSLVLLLCLPYGVAAKDNKAETCDIDVLGGGGIEMAYIFDLPGTFTRTTNYFYTASIGDNVAFCVNPGLPRGTTYAFYKLLLKLD